MQLALPSAPIALPPLLDPLARLRVRLSDTLLVRNAGLRRVFAAGLVSGFGDRLNQVALAALILALTHSVAQAGLALVVSLMPYVLFGLVAGALVDRWNRRLCLVGADIVRVVLVALIPAAAAAGLPLLYGLLFGITCARLVFTPAQQAIVPDLVGRDDLVKANSLIRTAQQLIDVIGYSVAGACVALLINWLGPLQGTQVAFGVDALTFVASAALLWRLPIVGRSDRPGSLNGASLAGQIAAGLRFLLAHPGVRTNTILIAVGALLLSSTQVLWVSFAWRITESGASGFGVLSAFMGAGTFAGALAVPYVSARIGKGRTILLGFLLDGLALVGMAATTALGIGALLAFFSGAGNMLFLVTSIAYVQHHTPAELRGRVFGVRLTLTYSAVAASNALAGWLADTAGASLPMVLFGTGAIVLAVVAYTIPSVREAN
jgi:MFS family permease